MPKLTDDPRVAEAIDKAEARGAKAERSRISKILSEASTAAGELEDRGHKKAVKDALKSVKDQVREAA